MSSFPPFPIPYIEGNGGHMLQPLLSAGYLKHLNDVLADGEDLTPTGVKLGWRQWRYLTRSSEKVGLNVGFPPLDRVRVGIVDGQDDFLEWVYEGDDA